MPQHTLLENLLAHMEEFLCFTLEGVYRDLDEPNMGDLIEAIECLVDLDLLIRTESEGGHELFERNFYSPFKMDQLL